VQFFTPIILFQSGFFWSIYVSLAGLCEYFELDPILYSNHVFQSARLHEHLELGLILYSIQLGLFWSIYVSLVITAGLCEYFELGPILYSNYVFQS
ncbi:12602_t:CDS:2, partial [Ambispora leptoticha]